MSRPRTSTVLYCVEFDSVEKQVHISATLCACNVPHNGLDDTVLVV